MHLKRLLTAIVALPLLILLISKGGPFLFFLLVALVTVVALNEYNNIVFHQTGISAFNPILMCGYGISLLIIGAAYKQAPELIVALVALNTILVGFLSIVHYSTDSNVLEVVYKQALGVMYIPVFLSCLVSIRNTDQGALWIFFILILVFIGDTGAFYTGRLFGKNKLCPAVSPGKTIEGAVGGLVASICAGLVFRHIFLSDMSLRTSILFFLCVGIIAPAGDLFESILKRSGQIKDSGSILPGHGGILDRIDAVLFASPVAYLFKIYIL